MRLILTAVLILLWAVTQYASLLFGGWGLVGAQTGHPGAAVAGVIVLVAPAAITLGALILAHRRPEAALACLGGGIGLLLLGVAVMVLLVATAR